MLSMNYQQLLTDLEITALSPQTPPLKYNPTKGLQGMRKDQITWSYKLSQYPDIISDNEAQLSSAVEEAAPDNGGDQHPPQRKNPPNHSQQQTSSTSSKLAVDKGKAPTKLFDPTLEMRRQVAANSKAIAAKARQAEGARRETERTRQAEA